MYILYYSLIFFVLGGWNNNPTDGRFWNIFPHIT